VKRIGVRNEVVGKGTPLPEASSYEMIWKFNPTLHKILMKHLQPGKEEKILDIGCGRGFCVQEVENYGAEVIGIDISIGSLREAVTRKVKYDDAMNLSFKADSFDKVYSLHTVEHVPNVRQFLSEIARVLKPGGIAITVYPWEPIRGIGAIAAAVRQYKNPLKARQIHLHRLTPKIILMN